MALIDYESLRLIDGIGDKTLADISRIYKSEDQLVLALKEDLVPLRDDVVKNLKEFYKID